MTREEMLNEVGSLRAAEHLLHAQIVPLKLRLKALEEEWVSKVTRRMDLERALINIKVLSYAGPQRKSRKAHRHQSPQQSALQAFIGLNASEREEFLQALEGKLQQAREVAA